ncbi:MAG: pantetheine-phosphate adenylyltransferase, partial [Candidatus Hydrothermarchaeaceae archaeon]
MKFSRVAVGGTFDNLHLGHEVLIEKAFEVGEYVIVGVVSDEMAGNKDVQGFAERKKALESFLSKFKNYEIVRLEEPYGPAVSDPSIRAIVVSEETEERAREINEIRKKKGIPLLDVIIVPFVLA